MRIPDWKIPGHVISIVPTADRQKATVRVRIGLDELDPRILPDMGIKVSFLEDASGRAAGQRRREVPANAIVQPTTRPRSSGWFGTARPRSSAVKIGASPGRVRARDSMASKAAKSSSSIRRGACAPVQPWSCKAAQ